MIIFVLLRDFSTRFRKFEVDISESVVRFKFNVFFCADIAVIYIFIQEMWYKQYISYLIDVKIICDYSN